jgi:adenine-specific DNA-methyltransferase
LEAVLNSDWTLMFMDLMAAKNRGGAIRWKHQYIEHLPIPHANEPDKIRLAELAEACSAATAGQDIPSLATLETEINQIVYRLFALTPEEIALIESSLA